MGFLPFSFVENQEYRNHISLLNKDIVVPSRKKLAAVIDVAYARVRRNLIAFLNSVDYIALTTDCWTDSVNTRSYLALTAHYLHGQKLEAIVLGACEFKANHTSENISLEIDDILSSWEINRHKIVAVTSDGAANVTNAIVSCFGQNRHLWCFAHQLNLIVKDSLKSNEYLVRLVTEVKSIVTYFKQSNIASYKLREALETSGLRSDLRLKQECQTRWNSTYLMIDRFIQLQIPVSSVCLQLENAPQIISRHNVNILQEVVKLLKPFIKLTEELSAEKTVTVSSVIPMIACLKHIISEIHPTETVSLNFRTLILKNIAKRFGHVENNELLSVATLLDARYKKIDFESPVAASTAKLIIDEKLRAVSAVSIESDDNEQSDSGFWAKHEANYARSRATTNTSYDSLRHFLSIKVIDRKSNPIEFWTENSQSYPDLRSLALKYLIIPATSVPCERVFSKAGNLITEKRNRLKPKNVNKMLVLSSLPKRFFDEIDLN